MGGKMQSGVRNKLNPASHRHTLLLISVTPFPIAECGAQLFVCVELPLAKK
jgi:hypothetical protein